MAWNFIFPVSVMSSVDTIRRVGLSLARLTSSRCLCFAAYFDFLTSRSAQRNQGCETQAPTVTVLIAVDLSFSDIPSEHDCETGEHVTSTLEVSG